jgi:hypothetical protein
METFSILSDCALMAPCHALFASETHWVAQSLDVMKNIQGGHLTTNSKSKRANSGLKFKEASVIGNPVAC